jgi:hypothetical protein
VSDFTVSNSVLAEKTSSHGLFKIYAMIMLSKHKMDVCSDGLTELVFLCGNYKPKYSILLTELKHDVEESDFYCIKKSVNSFSCTAKVLKAVIAFSHIDLAMISS